MTGSFKESVEREIEYQMKYIKNDDVLNKAQAKLDSMKIWKQKSLPIFINSYIESLMELPSDKGERFYFEKAIGEKTKEVLEYAKTL